MTTIHITGSSNDSNLVLGSASASIADKVSVDLTEKVSVVESSVVDLTENVSVVQSSVVDITEKVSVVQSVVVDITEKVQLNETVGVPLICKCDLLNTLEIICGNCKPTYLNTLVLSADFEYNFWVSINAVTPHTPASLIIAGVIDGKARTTAQMVALYDEYIKCLLKIGYGTATENDGKFVWGVYKNAGSLVDAQRHWDATTFVSKQDDAHFINAMRYCQCVTNNNSGLTCQNTSLCVNTFLDHYYNTLNDKNPAPDGFFDNKLTTYADLSGSSGVLNMKFKGEQTFLGYAPDSKQTLKNGLNADISLADYTLKDMAWAVVTACDNPKFYANKFGEPRPFLLETGLDLPKLIRDGKIKADLVQIYDYRSNYIQISYNNRGYSFVDATPTTRCVPKNTVEKPDGTLYDGSENLLDQSIYSGERICIENFYGIIGLQQMWNTCECALYFVEAGKDAAGVQLYQYSYTLPEVPLTVNNDYVTYTIKGNGLAGDVSGTDVSFAVTELTLSGVAGKNNSTSSINQHAATFCCPMFAEAYSAYAPYINAMVANNICNTVASIVSMEDVLTLDIPGFPAFRRLPHGKSSYPGITQTPQADEYISRPWQSWFYTLWSGYYTTVPSTFTPAEYNSLMAALPKTTKKEYINNVLQLANFTKSRTQLELASLLKECGANTPI